MSQRMRGPPNKAKTHLILAGLAGAVVFRLDT